MSEKILSRLIVLLVLAATVYRLFPIVLGQPWLSEFFITEDGYLMLTIARNMAIGLGMTVSEGTIPTNGVQPMATFLFAVPYWLTGGDKVTSLIGVIAISAVIALAAFFAVRALARDMLRDQDDNPLWPWLAAALWFTGPLLLLHTMNGLETGLYTLMAVLTFLRFHAVLEKGSSAVPMDRLVLGFLCGLTFLSRNDGAFLVTALFFVWMLHGLFVTRAGVLGVAMQMIPPGILSLVVAAPWLINNKINFGSFVPISGSAQAFGSEFGQNAALVPVKLFEYIFPMLPIPASVETWPSVIAVTAVVVAVILAVFLLGVFLRGGPVSFVVAAYVIYGLMLCGYYGLFFGAPHFMSRYLAPLAPLMIVAAVSVLVTLTRIFEARRGAAVMAGAGVLGLALSAALLVRLLLPGVHVHEHFQVVRYVQQNVPEEAWVGAPQTGTLGYWHDRTINLDGKVNPDALNTLLTEGHILNYVVASEITYLADWVGLAGWMQRPEANFAQLFELVVEDPAANLAVLRRRADAPPPQAPESAPQPESGAAAPAVETGAAPEAEAPAGAEDIAPGDYVPPDN